jgi:hypothetical protein
MSINVCIHDNRKASLETDICKYGEIAKEIMMNGNIYKYKTRILNISEHTFRRERVAKRVPNRCVPDRSFLDIASLGQSVPWILCP